MAVVVKEISPGTPNQKVYAMLIDEDGNLINASNPIHVDTEITVDGDLIVDNITIKERPPTHATKNNASFVLTYIGGELTQMQKTIGATTYTRTFTWVGGELTEISAWS